MSSSLICRPDGHFSASGSDAAPPAELYEVFRQGAAGGLLRLALGAAAELPPDPGLAWLHRFSQLWLAAVCRTRQEAPPPPPGGFDTLLSSAPPFPGSEYLAPATLTNLWEEAGLCLKSLCAARPGGLEAWLESGRTPWHLVGRITFHLAENQRDPDKPFAFLATYTDALGAAGKPRHLPLGRALQTFAAAQDQGTLDSILVPVRAAAAASPWVREQLESRRVFQAQGWTPTEAYQFLLEVPQLEQAGLTVKVPDWWKSGRPSRPVVQVKLDTDPSMLGIGAMLRCRISTTLDGRVLSAEDWDRIRHSGPGLIRLRGQWVEMDGNRLGEVLEHWNRVAAAAENGGLSFHEGMRFLAGFTPGADAAAATAETLTDWSRVVAGKSLAAVLAGPGGRSAGKPPAGLRASLRPYQEKGLAWLEFMRRLGLGACLADDMGLGKTLQVIALLTSVAEGRSPPERPALLVVPASLVGNWMAEFARFAPGLRVFAAHPSRIAKEDLLPALTDPENAFRGYHAVLTTYGLLQRTPALQDAAWSAVILDEAQAVKNAATAQARAVKRTRAPWKLALTGTPVENRPGDLWSLFDFLNPGLLGSAAGFSTALKRMAESPAAGAYAPLRRLIQPYLLRRLKSDKSIIADLPDKTEVTASCGLSRKQAVLYGKLVEQLKHDLNDDDLEPMKRRALVVGYLMQFKQVCNHPSHWSGDGVYAPADSGKFHRLAEICQELADRQERVIIFTQFREIIDPLHAFLAGIFQRPGLILHGGTPVKERQELVTRFQAPDGPPFFLLSVKAGGTGLTLTAASHVIHFDRWWNPAVENQATDRAHRIGQKQHVLVHKFVTAGTIEERIDEMITAKKATAGEILSAEGSAETRLTEMSADELLRFIALDANAVLGAGS